MSLTFSWSIVESTVDICGYCNKGNCGILDHSHWLFSPNQLLVRQQQKSASHNHRHVTLREDIIVGPLIFLENAEDYSMEWFTFSAHSSTYLCEPIQENIKSELNMIINVCKCLIKKIRIILI